MSATAVIQRILTAAVLLLLVAHSAIAASDRLAPELQVRVSANHFGDNVPVIITFDNPVDHNQLRQFTHKQERRFQLLTKLKQRTETPARRAFRKNLENRGVRDVRNLWISNSIAATVPVSMLVELATWPGIIKIRLDAVIQAPATTYSGTTQTGWNISAVHAPETWNLSHTGQGVVVAVFDTGVDAAHPDLSAQYRGGTNSWFDPYGQHATPYDAAGHGTSVAGIVVGRNATGSVIGMAPDARWIAARAFNDSGTATLSALHQSFQWLLDPDNNPATNDAPDVVNASWGLTGVPGGCTYEFQPDIQALKAAGIAIVFSAGNDGPSPSTSLSPANNPEGFAVGAVDNSLTLATFSARGPSACNGGIDPELVAPGVAVFTADTGFGVGAGTYAVVSGTSFAAPHVTGAIALMLSANPALSVSELETLLQQTAVDLGPAGADNDYGSGLLDVYSATVLALGDVPLAKSDTATTNEDNAVTIDVLSNDSDSKSRPLKVTAVASPSLHGGVTLLNADQTVLYTPAPNFNGTDSFTYTLSNGVAAGIGTVTVTVLPVNDPPVAVDDQLLVDADAATGQFLVAAPGVLLNDTDIDGDPLSAQLVSNVASGTVTLQPNGAVQYTPPPGGAPGGNLSFTYRVSDGSAVSNIATVRLSVNHPPVAQNDNIQLPPPDVNHVYTLASPGVLANDTDPDGDALTAALVTNVQSGSVTLDPQGGFRYTPPPGGVSGGTLSFTYRASDSRSVSNIATVSFTVNQSPVAVNDVLVLSAVSAAGPYTLPAPGILANDHDPDGDPLTPSLDSGVGSGSLTLATNGSLSYTPPVSGPPSGALGFSYRVSDGKVSSNLATVSFTLNLMPVAVEDTGIVVEINAGGIYEYTGNLLANDHDPDGDPVTARLLRDAEVGSVTLTAGGGFIYTPPSGSVPLQPLHFLYQLYDGKSLGGTAVVSFQLNPASGNPETTGSNSGSPAPVTGGIGGSYPPPSSTGAAPPVVGAQPSESARSEPTTQERATPKSRDEKEQVAQSEDDQFTLTEPDEHGHYTLDAPGVLANDSGDGKLTAMLVRNVRLGKVKLNPDGGFVYVPPRGGVPATPLTFTYRVRDSKGYSAEARVNLLVESGLEAKADEFVLHQRDAGGRYLLEAPGVLANDIRRKNAKPVIVRNVMVGQVILAANGSFVYVPPASGHIPRTPLNFVYRLTAGKDYSRVASVTFSLAQELAAVPDSLVLSFVDKAGRYILPAPGVLANDSGTGTLKAVLIQGVANGKLVLEPNGGLSYTPPAEGPPSMPLSFRYQVSDGKTLSKEAKVTLVLRPEQRSQTAAGSHAPCVPGKNQAQCTPTLAPRGPCCQP